MGGRIPRRQWSTRLVRASPCHASPGKNTAYRGARVGWIMDPLVEVSDFVTACPARAAALGAAIDWSKIAGGKNAPGMPSEPGRHQQALRAVLAHFRKESRPALAVFPARGPRRSGDTSTVAGVLRDTFCFYHVEATVPRRADGGLDWAWNGPAGDREWGWALNRHQFLLTLARAYRETGRQTYLEALDHLFQDWIRANPVPEPCGPTPQWRALEAALRLSNAWIETFFLLRDSPGLAPATRLLVLSSIPEHVAVIRGHLAPRGNIRVMHLVAILFASAFFPEFRASAQWAREAGVELECELLERQVYPDGVQKELTQHYHHVALAHFEDALGLAPALPLSFSPAYRARVELMWEYLARTIRPDGTGLLNNDSDLDAWRPLLVRKAERYGRPEWAWMATGGTRGSWPANERERDHVAVYPHAGQLVVRDGWHPRANWAFFDFGPFGTGHLHRDRLHLSVVVHGRPVLVDAGRYTYQGGLWRDWYFRATPAHNTLTVDRLDQVPEPAEGPGSLHHQVRREPGWIYAVGEHARGYQLDWQTVTAVPDFEAVWGEVPDDDWDVTGGALATRGEVRHARAVAFLEGRYWLVVDRVTTDRPRDLQVFWHFHPDCHVKRAGLSCYTRDPGAGNLRVVPLGPVAWEIEAVHGRTDPRPQGWFSPHYGVKMPAPCVVYSTHIPRTTTFAWVLVPGTDAPPVPVSLVADWQVVPRFQVQLRPRDPVDTLEVSVNVAAPRFRRARG